MSTENGSVGSTQIFIRGLDATVESLRQESIGPSIQANRRIADIESGEPEGLVRPVVQGENLIGWVDPRWIANARRLGLREATAQHLLFESCETLPATTPESDVFARMIQSGATGVLALGPDRTCVGIWRYRGKNIAGTLDLAPLGATTIDTLGRAGRLATTHSSGLWLVGGLVRDLCLGRAGGDLDLATEGPIGPIAQALADLLDGEVLIHRRFLTARIEFGPGLHLDLAQTRTESYRYPGALPDVRPGSLVEDLGRRDFTVNSMAIDLSPAHWGRLVDPHRGREDLGRNWLRVLHPLSFVEDPSRLHRAARFAHRLGWTLHPGTLRLARRSSCEGWMQRLSRARLGREWRLNFQVPDWKGLVRTLERCGVLRAIAAECDPGRLEAISWTAAETLYSRYRNRAGLAVSFSADQLGCLLLGHALGRLAHPWLDRLDRSGSLGATAASLPMLLDRLIHRLESDSAVSPLEIHRTCRTESDLALMAAACLCRPGAMRDSIQSYLEIWKFVAPRIDGNDLARAGLVPGPAFALALEAALDARLQNPRLSLEAELALALEAGRT